MGPRRISSERQWQFFASCFPIGSFRDLVMFHGSLGPLTCPRDFFLCGYLKAHVYEDKPRILNELKDTVRQHITQINRDLLERIKHIKSLVYETPAPDQETLLARILAASDEVREMRDVLGRVRQNFLRRYYAYIQCGGRQFEQLF
ncbi:hypothetical protein ANN_01743 [Periplaneta americana]|uniref:Uncharacterized protein n=1 Tax=Periplaneta americana TaxID=6978 RepID=A0ABQ8TVI2_PERAM|nr:hypothetical protein ANN_01743 [Periplaneta americana]